MIKKIALIFFAGALVLATGCKTKDVKMNSEKKSNYNGTQKGGVSGIYSFIWKHQHDQ